MKLRIKGSPTLGWNALDTRSTLVVGAVALLVAYAGPPIVAQIESWGGAWAVIVAPALWTAGHALYRWLNDNPDPKWP